MRKNRALFLDRDGIINEDLRYVHKPEQIRFCDGVFDLCGAAVGKGYLLVVVTNQAGVAKGQFSEADVRVLHQWITEQFAARGITLTAFYYCPYHENGTIPHYRKDSDCRKPKPGMFTTAAADHNIDLSASLMVGDKSSDRILLPELRCIIVKSVYTTFGYDVASIREVIPLL
ncbi:MAG: HAD family hydrolase [Chitinispirillaceae bacterium]|nr:HAD family hydrolase [Chitinispirillaceae bacterium]